MCLTYEGSAGPGTWIHRCLWSRGNTIANTASVKWRLKWSTHKIRSGYPSPQGKNGFVLERSWKSIQKKHHNFSSLPHFLSISGFFRTCADWGLARMAGAQQPWPHKTRLGFGRWQSHPWSSVHEFRQKFWQCNPCNPTTNSDLPDFAAFWIFFGHMWHICVCSKGSCTL